MRQPPSFRAADAASQASRRRRMPERRELPVPRGRPAPRGRHPSRAAVLRGVGAALLVAGWTAAGVFAWSPAPPDAGTVNYQIIGGQVYPIALSDSRRRRLQLQRMEGDMGVWITGLDARLQSLLRPPRLGWTILLLSTALGLGCLRLAWLAGLDVDD